MEKVLHATHPEPRFWAISVAGSTITLRTGPMHTPGTSRTIECKSDAAAVTTTEALVAQRLKDGFRVAEAARTVAAMDVATEAALLRDDVDAWVVFADSLLESTDSAPIGEVLEAVLQSPACRFLQRLEFGSPGNEGRYDLSLRTLAKLPWPAHLDSLFLGNFDVVAARVMGSAWPRLEGLTALTPVAARLRSLEVRAAFNTFGRSLSFPKLERLVIMPTALDARMATDLLGLEAPLLREFGLSCEAAPKHGWEGWARLIRQWSMLSKVRRLELKEQPGAIELLEVLGEGLKTLEAVDLTGSVRVTEIEALRSLAPVLRHATVAIGDASTVAKKVSGDFPKLDTTVIEVEKPKALKKAPARRPLSERYEEIVE